MKIVMINKSFNRRDVRLRREFEKGIPQTPLVNDSSSPVPDELTPLPVSRVFHEIAASGQ
jgi:hypothetical protein